MPIFNTIVELFRKPFPLGENRYWYYKSLGVLSLFVSLFLFIYKPFGMHLLKTNALLLCFGFGSMTFLGGAVYEIIILQIRNLKKSKTPFTFGKWSLNNFGIILCISLANFLFARLVFFGFIDWSLYPIMLYATFMIGIIPLTFIGGYILVYQEKKQQNFISKNDVSKSFLSDTDQLVFGIAIPQIKYVEALQNYVKIVYINREGQLKIQTERVTLKEIQSKVKGSSVMKCHRSYLVNTDAILHAEGNSQGLLLTLANCDSAIPVSRTWVSQFRKS